MLLLQNVPKTFQTIKCFFKTPCKALLFVQNFLVVKIPSYHIPLFCFCCIKNSPVAIRHQTFAKVFIFIPNFHSSPKGKNWRAFARHQYSFAKIYTSKTFLLPPLEFCIKNIQTLALKSNSKMPHRIYFSSNQKKGCAKPHLLAKTLSNI